MADPSSGMVIFAGNSHLPLVSLICERLNVRLGELNLYTQSNRETHVSIKQSIRGKDVFIIQSVKPNDVNNSIFELLILVYTCHTSCVKSVTVVMPYLPYSKQCRIMRRSSIPLKLLAEMICRAGTSRFISMDLYQKEIQGFFSIPVINLRASPFLIQYIENNILGHENAIIVAKYPDRLRLSVAVIHGEAGKTFETPECDGRQSPPREKKNYTEETNLTKSSSTRLQKKSSTTLEFLPIMVSKEKPPIHVVGEVKGKIAIVVDNIFDEALSFVDAADVLKASGAIKVYIVVTHGLFSGNALAIIEDSCIDEVIVTNTVSYDARNHNCKKIRVVDISPMICEGIRRVYHEESLSHLFKEVNIND